MPTPPEITQESGPPAVRAARLGACHTCSPHGGHFCRAPAAWENVHRYDVSGPRIRPIGKSANIVGFCDGFRKPARRDANHAHDQAGVRKPPRKEGAGGRALGSADAMGIWLAVMVQPRAGEASCEVASDQRRLDRLPDQHRDGPDHSPSEGYPPRQGVLRASRVVAGQGPAAQSSCSDDRGRRELRHDVSILIAVGR